MITHRAPTSRSDQARTDAASAASNVHTTGSPHRRELLHRAGYGSAAVSRGQHGTASIVMILVLGFFGCLSLVSQVAFIFYVSSMTFSRLESALYPPFIKRQLVTTSKMEAKPRIVGYYFRDSSSSAILGSERLDPNMHRRLTRNSIDISKDEWISQRHLAFSNDYLAEQTDPIGVGDCEAQYDWQTKTFPTCNIVHELDMTAWNSTEENLRILSLAGFWRDVWLFNSTVQHEQLVLKTLRRRHAVSERNFDRHRRDAMAMERLTSSPHIINIFAFCGNSGINEFADGGSLEDEIFKTRKGRVSWNSSKKLVVAHQLATALYEVHNCDKVGQASIAHTDITPAQFVYIKKKGHFVLNDFNRCRLIAWDTTLDKPCDFQVGNNPGTFRAPEEYSYDNETEKIDVYSLGNVYYSMLTSVWPFDKVKEEIAQRKIIRGVRPPINGTILHSQDPFTQAMLQAIEMCWKQNPKKRASAAQLESFLALQLLKMGMPQNRSGAVLDPTNFKRRAAKQRQANQKI